MNIRQTAPVVLACLALSLPAVGIAQTSSIPSDGAAVPVKAGHEAPIYDSAANADRASAHHFSSAEDDARPGEYFFGLAVQAFKKHDYAHAVDMYKVASSWAYKPAEYNLGVMYARGHGVPADLPRAMAWLTLAAERNDRNYIAARDLINSKLDNTQFKQANVVFGELLPTYGDATALLRAKARWAQVRASMTGSRVGSLAGNLRIGGHGNGDVNPGARQRSSSTAFGVLGANSVDGSTAYSQLVASNNPYDRKFEWRPGSGTVTVKPLSPIKKSEADRPSHSDNQPTDDSHPA